MKTIRREIRARWVLFILCLGPFVSAGSAFGEPAVQRASVVEPFLEIHTGPARSYPVFYIAERGEEILILKRRTDWYRIRLPNGKEGWAHRSEIEKTLLARGRKGGLLERFYDGYLADRLEMGWGAGTFGGDSSLYVRLTYGLTDVLSVEGNAVFASGNLGSTELYGGGIVVTPWKSRWIALSGTAGAGWVRATPSRLLVNVSRDKFHEAHAGLGFSMPLVRNLFLRGDFRNYTLFVNPARTREFQEYSLGLSFRF